MATAPSISLTFGTSSDLITAFTPNAPSASQKIKYQLQADGTEFYNWTDWVNDASNSPNAKQLSNAATYSNYAWKFDCTLSVVDNACGFWHPDHGAVFLRSNTLGEISAVADTSTAESNTYVMNKEQYT